MRDIYSSFYNLGLRVDIMEGIADVTSVYTVPTQRYVVVFYDPTTKLLDWHFFPESVPHSPSFEKLLRLGVVYISTDRPMSSIELADKLEAAVANLED